MHDPNGSSLKPLFLGLLLVLILAAGWTLFRENFNSGSITSFDECVKAGHPIMESSPEQCRAGQQTFINTSELSQ